MSLQSINARTGQPNGAAWAESTPGEIDQAAANAEAAADVFAGAAASQRAKLLRLIADGLEAQREALVSLADLESGLGLPRLDGELSRTTFQLRGFASLAEEGKFQSFLDDAAVAGAPPSGRPRLTRVTQPLGPVAMFAASNFPFAFSVVGGDTASALAVGCPVVVKAHPAHPELSLRVAAIAMAAVHECGLPEGVFQLVQGASMEVGVRLVKAPGIAAVAFTGSFKGGMALAKLAAERERPIPFYGELGSVNPVVVLPGVSGEACVQLADELAASISLGAGQFCTSPGVIVVFKGACGDAFVKAFAGSLSTKTLHPMLSPGIRRGFDQGVDAWRQHPKLTTLVDGSVQAPFLAEVDQADFIAQHELRDEVFGSAALVVRVGSHQEVCDVLRAVGGSLTVTLWGVPAGAAQADEATLGTVRAAMKIAGRVLFAGVPTGVAVTAAQQHGGPFPASTAPLTTSVGYGAAERFLRPVALQDAPQWLLERKGMPL